MAARGLAGCWVGQEKYEDPAPSTVEAGLCRQVSRRETASVGSCPDVRTVGKDPWAYEESDVRLGSWPRKGLGGLRGGETTERARGAPQSWPVTLFPATALQTPPPEPRAPCAPFPRCMLSPFPPCTACRPAVDVRPSPSRGEGSSGQSGAPSLALRPQSRAQVWAPSPKPASA